jgi:hypothetical protein
VGCERSIWAVVRECETDVVALAAAEVVRTTVGPERNWLRGVKKHQARFSLDELLVRHGCF